MNLSVHCLKSECFPALKEIGFYGVDLSFDNQKPPLEYSIPSRNAFYKMAYEVSKDIIEDRLL